MRFVDLSHPLVTDMQVYPGDPSVRIEPALTIARDGVAVERMNLGSHTGTHLDAPSHSVVGGRTVDQIPLDLLWGEARVLRATADAGAELGPAEVAVPSSLPSIVCVATGWSDKFGTPEVTNHPYLSRELAALLWERGARVLGVDTLSPDATSRPELGMPVHEFWLGNDGVIVENLTSLDAVPDAVELSILPLRLAGVDGSPVRAVARFAS